VDHVRAGRWEEAAVAIDALSEAQRKRPEIRFLRARVAAELGRAADVVSQLDGLEKEIPPLAEAIARLRAEAQADVGPFDAAALYLSSRPGLKSLTRAAQAYLHAGKDADARRVLDRAIAGAKGGRAEASARALRMSLASKAGDTAAARTDARWIALSAPESAEAAEALAVLGSSARFTRDERLSRADRLASTGKIDDALAELEAAGREGLAGGQLTHARAGLLYKARRYADAADEYAKAAKQKADTLVEDLFYGARSLSRAQKDDDAIAAYRALAKAHPRSPFAEEASYLAARLAFLMGKNQEAATSFVAYFKRHKAGKHARDAAYDLALVHLALHDAKKARAALSDLVREEDSKLEAARLKELLALATERAGDTAAARTLYAEVIRTQPLSLPALLSEARLRKLGTALPVRIEPAETGSAPPLAIKLPPVVELLAGMGLSSDAEDALRLREKEVGAAFAPRTTEALCTAYGMLDQAERRYRLGQDGVRAETLTREPNQANRWAWECLYPRPYSEWVDAAERRESLPKGLLFSVMRQESAFDPDVVSAANAVGLLQLLPTTARRLAKDASLPFEDGWLTRPTVNVDLGARYLSVLIRMWKGNVPLAVASYNAGPRAVSRWLEHAKTEDLDLFLARIPYGETRSYVTRVMGNLARYAYLSSGVEAVPEIDLTVDPSLRAAEDAF
jgi:soluble lytic murein transglycosylase